MDQAELIKLAENNRHISESQILSDIEDTEKEISAYVDKLDSAITLRDRLGVISASKNISEREEFIKKLKSILTYRKNNE